jgi:hypothetical protein
MRSQSLIAFVVESALETMALAAFVAAVAMLAA